MPGAPPDETASWLVRRFRWLVGAMLVGAALAAGYTSWLINQQQAALVAGDRDRTATIIGRAVMEAVRLQEALVASAVPEFDIDEDTRRLRLDVMRSRLRLVSEGKILELLRGNPDHLTTLRDVNALLDRIDAVIDEPITPAIAGALREEMIDIVRRLIALDIAGVRASGVAEDAERVRLSGLHWTFSMLLVGVMVASLLLTFAFTHLRLRMLAQVMRARDAAEAANRAKTQFLANMSHELRTPMNGVLGLLDLIIKDGLPERQLRFAQTAHRSGAQLLELIAGVLDLSKIEAGRMKLEAVPMCVVDLIGGVRDLMGAQAHAKQIALHIEVPETLPPRVLGDPMRLRQVLMNLVGNAIKFTDTGEVVVSLTHAEEGGLRRLNLSVRDSGIGIPPDRLPHIFDVFAQVDDSTTRRFGGSGLGLSIVRELVDLMGGEIKAESTPGTGSIFHISLLLPSAPADAAPAPLPSPLPPVVVAPDPLEASAPPVQDETQATPAAKLHALLVDDSAVNRLVASEFLLRCGCSFDMAVNGKLAVEKAQARQYDIIFMDLQMPVMDGFTATEEIRARERAEGLPQTPVIALTGNVLAEDRARSAAVGMNDFLSKPVDEEGFRTVINRWTARATEAQAA